MLQLVYISSAVGKPDVNAILAVSRRNNGRDEVTGLLYADGVRFLQALEGPEAKVEAAFARIHRDPRHRAVVVLSRRTVDEREFGAWQMAHRMPGADGGAVMGQVAPLLARTHANVRATFDGFMQINRAA